MDIVAVCPCGATTHEVAETFSPLARVPYWLRCWACGRLAPARHFKWPAGFTWLPENPFAVEPTQEPERDAETLRRQIYRLLTGTMRSIQWLESRLAADELEDMLSAMERVSALGRESWQDRSESELRSALRELERIEALLQEAMVRP